MAIACPNKNTSEWKELADKYGDNVAESLFHKNKQVIPTTEQARALIRRGKVRQFKDIVNHLDTTVSNEVPTLLDKLSPVIQKSGNDLYVIKGSKLGEVPKSGAQEDIHAANVKFLEVVNKSIGPLFNISEVKEITPVEVAGAEVIDALRNSEGQGMYAMMYKNYVSDPTKHAQVLQDLVQQATGGKATRNELEKGLGKEVVDKVLAYNESLNPTEEKLAENKTAATQGFFSDVVSGISEKFKPKKPFEPILPFTKEESAFKKVFDKFKGKFDEHIATSIPTFRELQVKVGTALSDIYKKGGVVYDIGGSEGGFVKAISESTGGKVKGINLDVNESMKAAHEATPVPGSEFKNEAFLEPYTDEETGKTYPKHVPTEKADVVHESMVFQFISPERKQFIKELKENYLKSDGIALLEEKVLPSSEEEWKTNEKIKDQYKLGFYPQEALTAKAEQVLVGMKKNQTAESDLVTALRRNFDYVGQYWDSGNFKGYIATDSKAKFDEFRNKVGDVSSEYSSRDKENLVAFENNKQTAGPNIEKAIQGETPAPGTHKVEINQDVLNKLAADNADKKTKDQLYDQNESLDVNKSILDEKAPKYSKAYGDAQVTTVNYNVLNALKNKFNLPFETVNDPSLDYRGKFENGKVIINVAKVNEYTALHEYLHPFVSAMQQDNPELYNNLISELQSTEEGKKAIETIKREYPELAPKDQLDEALVTHMSELTRMDQIKSKPWYQQLIDWFKNLFAKNNISISGIDMNTRINDLADKIVDPSYSADLKKYYSYNDAAVKFQKDYLTQEHSDNFNQILEKVKNKLTLDVSIPAKTKEDEQRKFFSGRQLSDLQANKNVYQALNDYVTSAIINAKKINDKFEQFKSLYEANDGKLQKDKMLEGMGILSDMENHVALYNESRFVVDAIRQENIEEFEDNFQVLQNRLNGDTSIINNYHEYGLKLMADWLYPQMRKTIDTYVRSGKLEKMPGYNEYLEAKAKSPNIEQNDQIEQGVKKWLRGQMEHATSDIGFFNSYMSGVLNSKDPISNLVALSLKEEFAKNNAKLYKVKTTLDNVVKKARGTKIFSSNADHKEFYQGFLHQVDNWEKTGYDEDGNAKFEYVKRTAFHEPFRYDTFYKAKREFFQKLGVRPNKSDEAAYNAWTAKKEAWFNEHTVRKYDDNGNLLNTNPSNKYVNPEFAKVANDPVFKELKRHYDEGNNKLGKYQLKYGIVPQQEVEGGLLKGVSAKKSAKENAEELKQNVKESISSKLGGYYAQDIDGKEYKNVPIRWTRMVPEDRLSYNLAKSVSDFWESSSKYDGAKTVEPMVKTLRNFIEGNAFLKINERDAPEVDAKGIKRMGNYVKNITKTKEQPNINRQLVDFLNDTIYGESEKKANIKSPFLNLKYLAYKADDTSVNGKPHREYVYSLEDLKKKTGNDTLDHDHFTKGVEKDVNGYKVTLLQNDKILSVNKLSKKLNSVSAVINLGGNVIAGTSHLLRGVASNFIEATGGKYFNNKEWASAYKEYFKSLTDFSFAEDTRGGKGSKISQLLQHYGTFQGEFLNEFGKHIGEGVVNKLFRRSSLFFSIHGAEHMVQTTQMIAAMKHLKLSDGKTSLYDAWEKGADGYIKIKDGLKWDDTRDNDFKNLIQSINKDRGNYSEFDKAALSRLWWGKMIIMFRRHIFNGIKSRFGASYVDYERGGATQGYYRSFITSLSNEINEFRLNGKFRKLDPEEAYHFKKTLADIGLFAMLAGVLVPAFRNDDDEKNGWDDYAALFARRLQMDVSFYYDPLEWKKVIQSPIVTGSTVDKMADFMSQAAISPSEVYEKDGAGYAAGDNKAITKLKKLLPVYRVGLNLQNPQDLLKFYDLKRPINK